MRAVTLLLALCAAGSVGAAAQPREIDIGAPGDEACVVRLAELHRNCVVLTTDRDDFSVYRRHGRQPIACRFPPKRD